MDFLQLVTSTRSCRRFEDQPLAGGTLDWLCSCARMASCAGNAQALRFALAESPEACDAVFPALKWAAMLKDWDGPASNERPTGYIVLCTKGTERGRLDAIDAGIAAQTIQIAAQCRDIGCCILLAFDHDAVRQALDIPAPYEPMLVLALGYQKEIRVVVDVTDPSAPDALRYWRDEREVHHVPKLGLDTLILVRK